MVTVAPSKDWWADGKRYGTARDSASRTARKFSLRINSRLELPKYAIQEVLNACPEGRCAAEGFNSFLERSKTPVVSDVGVIASKPERVTSMDRAEILVSLDKVLWAPEGDGVARSERGISRHSNEVPLNFGS